MGGVKNNIKEFAEKYLTFEPHPWHETLFKYVTPHKIWWHDRGYGNKGFSDYITNDCLQKMKQGQKFGLATPEGMFVFKLEEIRRKP